MGVAFDFGGEVALVTGAATGLGFAIAEALGQAGATVALTDLSRDRAEAAVAALREQNVAAYGWAADVRDADAMARVLDEIGQRHGRLDIAVASAGIYPNTPLMELTPEEWDRVLDTNLKGAFITCQAAARLMIAGGRGGRIVTISSGAANHAIWGWAHYSASKAGVVALTRTLALELAPYGIRANAVLPGYIDVPEGGRPLSDSYKEAARRGIPLRRGEPADIANAVVMLTSPLAGFVTGTALSVDGGSSAGRAHLRPVEE